MARNDVYLNINALSPADAVVTGQQDMTAATVPELVLGDTPTFNFLFTDNTNVWPSWAGNASYTLTWALSDAVAGDFAPAATTGNATPITGGWSVILPLNSYDLVGLLNTKRVGQPYPVQNLWQQLRVTDPSGNEVTRAMFWTPVRYRAISDTQNTESASPTGGRFVTVNNVNTLTTPTAAQFYAANPVPTSALGTAANGELLIGNGTGFTKSTLTAGTGITVTNGSGSITIDASGAQETLTATVTNAEAVPITKGQVVYIFGATGNRPSVKLAYNTSDATSAKTFGVVSDSSISAGGTGTVTCVGVVDGLNLGAYQDGDTLYLGATPGSVTATKPYAPNHLVYVGIIERANAGNGELYVRVQNGYELDEIHDVQITAPKQSGQTLIYDNTTSLWKNARITAGSNIAVTNGDGSISIGFSGTLPVANGGTGVTTSTGSGSVVLSTSPTLTTPILGTPQSGTLSSCTGLPISTGVSGLGTNVATFLATPSSANLASAVTDETGTGALVFANTPTLVTPNIGAATGTSFNLTGSGTLGTTLTVNSTTDSSSKDTGAIVTEGGLGVEKSATFGGNLTVSGAINAIGQNIVVSPSSGTAKGRINSDPFRADVFQFGSNWTGGAQDDATKPSWYWFFDSRVAGDRTTLYRVPAGGSSTSALVISSTATTISDNLTVSGGTATISKSSTTTGPVLQLENTNDAIDAGGTLGRLQFYSGDDSGGGNSVRAWIDSIQTTTTPVGSALRFAVANGANAAGEVVRIAETGNFLIGGSIDGGQKLQVSGTGYFSGNVGIGATSGTGRLTVYGGQTEWGATSSLGFLGYTGGNPIVGSLGALSLLIYTNGTEAARFDSSQNATFAGAVTVSGADKVLTVTSSASTPGFTMRQTGGIAANRNWGIVINNSANGDFILRRSTTTSGDPTTAVLTFDSTGNATFAGSIAIGNTVNTVSPTSPNRTITMTIGGTTYYIHAKTTND